LGNGIRALASASLSREYGLRPDSVLPGAQTAPKWGLEVLALSGTKHTAFAKWGGVLILAALIGLGAAPVAFAQQAEPKGESKGENFSAKPAAQLFASDCTGAGCHKGPQGLAKGQGTGSLAGFLREHYTNSRESAAAIAAYLTKQPSAPEQGRAARGGKPAAAPASGVGGWFESNPSEPAKPSGEPKNRPGSRTSTAARHEEPAASQRHEPENSRETPPKPTPRERSQRGRQHQPAAPAATASTPPSEPEKPAAVTSSAPEPPAAVAAAPPAAAPPAPAATPAPAAAAPPPAPAAATRPAKKQYDIFD
jgi:hypothetical protein